MPCPYCEAPLVGTPTVCPECGKPLRASAPAAAGGGVFDLLDSPGVPLATVKGTVAPSPAAPPDPIVAVLERNTREDIGDVPIDPVPDMIDPRLFGAYLPPQLETPQLAGLENTEPKAINVPNDPVPDRQSHRFNEMPPVGPNVVVPGEVQVVGMIDQRLFGAFVPAQLETPAMENIQYTRFEDLVEHDAGASVARPSEEEIPLGSCAACGVQFRSRACPECGNPMIVKPEE